MSGVEVLSPVVRADDFPDQWYDLGDASHFWFRWRLAVLERMLKEAHVPRAPSFTALDVGCGHGVLALQLEQRLAWTVDATDLNMAALERCAPRRGRTFYYDVRERLPQLTGRYDAVVLFDVIEHLAEPRSFVESVLGHVKAGGLLLINVPAQPMLMSEYDRAVGHLRRYTLASLEAELAGLALTRIANRYWGLSLVPLLLARKLVLARGDADPVSRGFRPPSRAVNAMLSELMRLEVAAVREPPSGTSVMYMGRVT